MSSDSQVIAQKRQEWIAAVNGRNVERYAQLLTEDVVWIPPGQLALHGREAFKAWLRPFFVRFDYDFVLEDPKVRVAGDWAVERGSFQTTMTSLDDGQSGSHMGKYLVLWRRESRGRWLIERYVDESG